MSKNAKRTITPPDTGAELQSEANEARRRKGGKKRQMQMSYGG